MIAVTMGVFRGCLLCILLWRLGVYGCGTLKSFSRWEGDVPIGTLQLYPAEPWVALIKENKYRWLRGRPWKNWKVYYSSGRFIADPVDSRLHVEDNYTLIITNMSRADEDDYVVECFVGQSSYNRTRFEQLTLPTRPETKPTTLMQTSASLTSQSTGPNPGEVIEKDSDDNNGAMIIVALLTSVIIALILVIFCLVIRNRVKSRQRQLDRRAIAKEEETQPSDDNSNQGENVYNEIADYVLNDPDITYAQVKKPSMVGSLANVPPGWSPSLPRRDQERSKSVENILLKSNASLDDTLLDTSSSLQNIYAKVIPKALRESETAKTTNRQSAVDVINKMDKNIVRKSQRSTIKKNGCQYKSMDCILSEPTEGQGHEYTNTSSTLPRSFRRKDSRSNAELTYIEIDHGDNEEEHTSHYVDIEALVIGEAPSSEYVSIDFDKKAFIAPIRKAPSSWYRKRKERKEKIKQQK